MMKALFLLFVGFMSLGLLTEVLYSQDSLKRGYDHPHYDRLWPYDIEFNKDFFIPDSIISTSSGEIIVGFEYDILGNIYNIYIDRISLKEKDTKIIYEYRASVYNSDEDVLQSQDKDLMYYRISHIIHDYIYNELKLIRNDRPFFRERYRTGIIIRF